MRKGKDPDPDLQHWLKLQLSFLQAGSVKITLHCADGSTKVLKESLKLKEGEVIDASRCFVLYLHCKIRLVSFSAKFDLCTVVGLNRTLLEAKMRTFNDSSVPSGYFSFKKCPI